MMLFAHYLSSSTKLIWSPDIYRIQNLTASKHRKRRGACTGKTVIARGGKKNLALSVLPCIPSVYSAPPALILSVNVTQGIMGQDTPDWGHVPSLEGLEIDWDFEPENRMGKRVFTRLIMKDLTFLLGVKEIPVKCVTEKIQTTAFLIDVSQGGISLRTKTARLKESELVKVGFYLAEHKVISKGRIKHVRREDDWYIAGVEFVGLMGDNHEYIASLYSSIKTQG